MIDLVNMDFSYNQAINIIWYFFDKKTKDDYKLISDKKLEYIFALIASLRKTDKDIEQFTLYDLIGIYKSELYDSRKDILLRQKRYISSVIFTLCNYYQIKVNKNNYEDFESEIKYYLLLVVNRSNLNVHGQIIKYMDLTVKGYFRTYLKRYMKQNTSLSLDDTKYSNDRNSKKGKTISDYVADPKNQFEEPENNAFSESMMEVLSSLEPDDLSLIMLRYQEDYSDEELANHFHLSLDEINQKEIKILTLLKNDSNLKLLKKI